MRTLLTLLGILLLTPQLYSQSQRASQWYFGHEAGVDFSSGEAIADTSSNLISIEGSAAISDTSGNLLFYSDGEKICNREHQIMANGEEIQGWTSSTQGCMIVPFPGNEQLYILFTTLGDSFFDESGGLFYSVIDMDLDNGLGAVTKNKNIQLHDNGTEELAATLHCNGSDYWIVSRQKLGGAVRLLTYLLSEVGISDPIIAEFPANISETNDVGNLCFSQDGSTLGFAGTNDEIWVFDFDKEIGALSFRDSISVVEDENLYSCAFSPDGSKLYTTSWILYYYSMLSQYDLTADDVGASRYNIDSVDYSNGSPNGYGFIGQIRLAPDQKIYVNRWHQDTPFEINPDTYYSLDSLDAIHFPNELGASCDFQRNSLYLDHKPTQLGLPTFVSSFTSPTTLTNTCEPITNIEYSTKTPKLSVYPNPFSDLTNLSITGDVSDMSFYIYNQLGQLVHQIDHISTPFQLDRNGLPSGIYMICLKKEGQSLTSKKIIITDK